VIGQVIMQRYAFVPGTSKEVKMLIALHVPVNTKVDTGHTLFQGNWPGHHAKVQLYTRIVFSNEGPFCINFA
jgi:hypothetical protein